MKIPEPSKALITSREQKIPQAWAVSIKGLEPSEALMLIRNEGRRLGLNSIQEAEDQILMRLYKATGGAPLAIKWAVGQIKQKGQSLNTVLSALHEAKGDIFEEIFARSWSLLSYDAKKVLMVMPIFASSASREAIEAASDVHHFALDEALGQLVQMWMVEVMDELEQAKRRYSVHPLTRAFAESQLEESKELQNIAKERLLTYFLNFTKKYGKRNWRGYDKLELERENILSIITWCYDSQKWQQVIEFHDSLIDFLWIRGYWDNRLKFAFQTLEASKQIGSQWSLAFCMVYDLGWTYLRRQEYEIAKDWINEGLQIFEMLNDNYGIAIAMRNLGNIATREKSISEAQELYKKSLINAEAANLDHLAYEIRCSIGNLLSQELTKYQEAQLQLEMSKKYFQKVGDDIRFSTALFGIAVNESIHGNSNDAKKLFHECLNLTKKIGRRDQLANILWFLALEEEKSNNILSALKYVKESNESFERLGLKYEYEQTKELIEKLEKKIH